MPDINFINNSWHKQFDDTDFLDKKKLVGRVYHLMLNGMMAKTPEDRHAAAVEIVIEVVNSTFPCCTSCGKRLHNLKCQSCKLKSEGILGIIN